MNFSVAISHADFMPSRVAHLPRLLAGLGMREGDPRLGIIRGKCSVKTRSEFQWNWGLESGADFCIAMDDDIVPCPDFWRHVEGAVLAHPDEIISLYAITPVCAELARQGYTWALTREGCLGTTWIMRRNLLGEFTEWRARAFDGLDIEDYSEDTQICLFALATGRRIWTTLPSLVETVSADVIPSTSGQTAAMGRLYTQTSVPWYPPPDGDDYDWSKPPGEGGWAFADYHWHLATRCKRGTVTAAELEALERDRFRWSVNQAV